MSASYLVYQLRPSVYNEIDNESYVSRLLYKLMMLDLDTVDTVVSEAIANDMFQPTMFIHIGTLFKDKNPLEEVFDAGNTYGSNSTEVININRPTSLSVGNLVVHLQDNVVYACMPRGWHELSRELVLGIKL